MDVTWKKEGRKGLVCLAESDRSLCCVITSCKATKECKGLSSRTAAYPTDLWPKGLLTGDGRGSFDVVRVLI